MTAEEDKTLPITEHLRELRNCLIKIVVAWAVCAIGAWFFIEEIFGVLLKPAIQALGIESSKLQAIAPTEIFLTYLKCTILAGFVLSLPVTFWQLWSFVAPGLYRKEKRFLVPFVLASTLLFVGGAGFGYAFVFPFVFKFFIGFTSSFVESAWTLQEVFSFTTHMFLAFGAAFETPLLVVALAMMGLVSPKQLLAVWPYAVVICFAAGAVLTPPDVFSQLMLAVPLISLYFIGVIVAFLVAPGRREPSA